MYAVMSEIHRDWKHVELLTNQLATIMSTATNVYQSPPHSSQGEPGEPLDILSATSYDEVFDLEALKAQSIPRQMYGGFIIDESYSQDPTARRKTKRLRTEQVELDEEEPHRDDVPQKKQRGRPRVERDEDSPRERRRTQIRLAQRTYRQRKESTISDLKRQVLELQSLLGDMNRSFLQFHDNLCESGLLKSVAADHRVVRHLQQMMEHFAEVSNRVPSEKPEVHHPYFTHRAKGAIEPEHSSGTPISSPRTATNQHHSSEGEDVDLVSIDKRPVTLSEIAELESKLFSVVESFRRLPIEKPVSSTAQYTYSFQETNYARRLHRQALERGFQFLATPSVNPGVLSRVFRLSFTFSNRERMLNNIRSILTRRAGESLENWHIPFFTVGGAGTHFPKRDKHGAIILPTNAIDPVVAVGPIQIPNAETPRSERSVQEVLEAIGFGGEWFDSRDVDEYLKSRGIHLEAQSSFATFYPDASWTEKVGLWLQPELHAAEDRTRHEGPHFVASSAPGQFLSSEQGNQEQLFQANRTAGQRAFTLDVDRFTSALVERAVCLGRAPGFRRSHVERTLNLAISEAF